MGELKRLAGAVCVLLCTKTSGAFVWEDDESFLQREQHAVLHVRAPENVTSAHRLRAYARASDGRCAFESPIGTSYEPILEVAPGVGPYFELHALVASISPVEVCLEFYDGDAHRRVMIADATPYFTVRPDTVDTSDVGDGLGLPDAPRTLHDDQNAPCDCTDEASLLRNPFCMGGGSTDSDGNPCGASTTAISLIRNVLFRGALHDGVRLSAAERCLAALETPRDAIDIQDAITYLKHKLLRTVPPTYFCGNVVSRFELS